MEHEASEEGTVSESDFVRTITRLSVVWIIVTVGAGILLVLYPEPFLNLYS